MTEELIRHRAKPIILEYALKGGGKFSNLQEELAETLGTSTGSNHAYDIIKGRINKDMYHMECVAVQKGVVSATQSNAARTLAFACPNCANYGICAAQDMLSQSPQENISNCPEQELVDLRDSLNELGIRKIAKKLSRLIPRAIGEGFITKETKTLLKRLADSNNDVEKLMLSRFIEQRLRMTTGYEFAEYEVETEFISLEELLQNPNITLQPEASTLTIRNPYDETKQIQLKIDDAIAYRGNIPRTILKIFENCPQPLIDAEFKKEKPDIDALVDCSKSNPEDLMQANGLNPVEVFYCEDFNSLVQIQFRENVQASNQILLTSEGLFVSRRARSEIKKGIIDISDLPLTDQRTYSRAIKHLCQGKCSQLLVQKSFSRVNLGMRELYIIRSLVQQDPNMDSLVNYIKLFYGGDIKSFGTNLRSLRQQFGGFEFTDDDNPTARLKTNFRYVINLLIDNCNSDYDLTEYEKAKRLFIQNKPEVNPDDYIMKLKELLKSEGLLSEDLLFDFKNLTSQ